MFNSNEPNSIIFVTGHNKVITKFDYEKKRTIAQFGLEDSEIKYVNWGFEKVAIVSQFSITLLK